MSASIRPQSEPGITAASNAEQPDRLESADQSEPASGPSVGPSTVAEAALLLSASELVREMEHAVRGVPVGDQAGLARLVVELVRSNLRQWDLEDASRDPHASDAKVATAKRTIDHLNLDRHRLVEEIDAHITASLDQSATAALATESPGMVLDRLSVLVIRRARTAEASFRDDTYAVRLSALDAMVASLSGALDGYLHELCVGTRRFVAYEHLKLYSTGPLPPAAG
jgi:hypothetical protein